MGNSETSRWEYILGHDKYLGVPRRRYVRSLTVSCDLSENEYEIARSLVEVLPSFLNLRSLQCDYSSGLIEQYPRLVECIPNLVQLTEIELQEFFRATLPSLPAILAAPNLTTVTLWFAQDPEDVESWDVSQAFALLSTLAALPSLFALSLTCPDIDIPPRSTTMRIIPMLSSLRHMIIDNLICNATANIVAYCPNLTTLKIDWHVDYQEDSDQEDSDLAHLPPLTEDVWPSIHELDCCIPLPSSCTGRFGRASKVTMHYAHLYNHKHFLSILSETRPSCLRLIDTVYHFDSERGQINHAWKRLAKTLPQLRSLLLWLRDSSLTEDFVNVLLDVLRPLPLTHFSFRVNTPKTYGPLSMAGVNRCRTQEVRRVDTLRALPDALPRALPHLRVFSLGPCKTVLREWDRRSGRPEEFWKYLKPDVCAAIQAQDAVDEEWGEMSAQVDEHLRELRRREDETAGLRNERWWWVEGEGEERRAIEIWKEKGEWARDVIEGEDFQPGDLTGMFRDSWRYEP
ncbi:uncharacterized protein BXZ73DRAFT_104463 [Epithele typhae]|uniref:uncharacterized protein n=1 Tax=Epithele typhae TaxID=378194 RepID=UPI0020082C76|nr:uncharacterized protein BXZ73DRAFT_104463 [Epithele typhae]KAH9921176.1 hypothetical protein BXZ73DRAFT_104463 [Epithele typhae]